MHLGFPAFRRSMLVRPRRDLAHHRCCHGVRKKLWRFDRGDESYHRSSPSYRFGKFAPMFEVAGVREADRGGRRRHIFRLKFEHEQLAHSRTLGEHLRWFPCALRIAANWK